MVGRGHMDGIDVVAGQQIAEVGIRLAIFVAVPAVDLAFGTVADTTTDIGNRDVLNVSVAKESTLSAERKSSPVRCVCTLI